ncbi:ribonuclease H-like domain-containing protein [Tanacetum coccineum]
MSTNSVKNSSIGAEDTGFGRGIQAIEGTQGFYGVTSPQEIRGLVERAINRDFMTGRVLLRCDSTGDLYPVTTPSPIPQAFLVSQHTWHQRLGHPGSEVLRRLVSSNFIPCNKEKPLILCHAYQLGKHSDV